MTTKGVSNGLKFVFDLYLGLVVFVSLVILVYIGFTNQAVHEGVFNKTLMAALFVTLISGTLFFFRGQYRINAALIHFSVVFSLFLVNLLLEIPVTFLSEREVAAFRMGKKFDRRGKYQVLDDLKKQNIQAYPAALFPVFVSDEAFFRKKFGLDFEKWLPLNGIARAETIICNESGEWALYSSDRYGFNNDDQVYEEKKGSVLLLGDSFVHGSCVAQKDTIAGNLRSRGYKAISLGMGGSGPLSELATLKEYGKYLKPKVILWFFYEVNDYADLQKEYNFLPLKKYLETGHTQGLFQRQAEVDRFWIDFFNKAKSYSINEYKGIPDSEKVARAEFNGLMRRMGSLHNVRKFLGLSRSGYLFEGADTGHSNEVDAMFTGVMRAAKEEARSLGSELYFVRLPALGHFLNPKTRMTSAFEGSHKVIAELGIPVIDFYEDLKNAGDPKDFFPLRTEGHYNPKGYALLGEAVERTSLKGRGLLEKEFK